MQEIVRNHVVPRRGLQDVGARRFCAKLERAGSYYPGPTRKSTAIPVPPGLEPAQLDE